MPVNSSTSGVSSLISGQVAGIDVPATVDGLLGLRKFEISQLQKTQDELTTRQAAFQQINDAAVTLRNTSIGMAKEGGFFDFTASLSTNSSNVSASNLLDVNGTSGLVSGQHQIVISQVAQAERLSSSISVKDSVGSAIASSSSVLNISGAFQLAGVTVNVAASDSLNDIATNINQLNSGASATGVTASVMKVTDNDFRLVLAADVTGVSGFALTGAALDAAGSLSSLQLGATGQPNAHQVLQPPQDAQLSIDGLGLIRSTNTISDALSGVTLNLKQADAATTINMTIGVDQQLLRNKVQSFVDAYNGLQSLIDDQFKFDVNTGVGGALAGEALLTTIKNSIASNLFKTVPGLPLDRNSMVAIGVEPDVNGLLIVNEDRFGVLLATDTNAIRDVFVAQGSSSNSNLQFLTHGLSTPSGTYDINITQAASKASAAGTADLSAGLSINEAITITATGNARQAVVNLTQGQTQSQIISAINTELSTNYTEKHQLATALTSGGSAAVGATTFSALGLAAAAGDSISISGTLRSGAAVSGSYSVLDPNVDTISGLLSAIQAAFNQEVLAAMDVNGNVTLTDLQSGDSQLTVSLTANNEGGGSLSFGSDVVSTEGRYALGAVAIASGNGVAIESTHYGSGGFAISQTANGLGITDASYAGTDVVGTINGLAATGKGQVLTGTSGDVDAMAVLYSGSAIGAVGSFSVGVGIAADLERKLELFANPVFGLIQNSILFEANDFDAIGVKITKLTAQMELQRTVLLGQFARMQTAMASLQQSESFLTQNTNAQNSNN